jgi:glycosyltransferase involved in cell wall biosynthesis
MSAADLIVPPARYGIIITRHDLDRFGHNALFAHELTVAMRHHGVPVRSLDYRSQPTELFATLREPSCAFVICFNGFGSELMFPTGVSLNSITSVFTAFSKPLLDFMHDCPAHDTMKHQVEARFPQRILLMTDYGYANVARAMGFPTVSFVPSITFPATVGPDAKPIENRSIPILLPVSLPSPNVVAERFVNSKEYKNRIYSTLFDSVTAAAVADWRIDPLAELLKACRDSDCGLDFGTADARFLLTAVVDYVKFARRRRLLRAVAHLPVTVISDRAFDEEIPGNNIRFEPPRSATGLLQVMADSQCVVCPTPHMTGFHERALGAFTAGAVVVSTPNEVVETNFIAGGEFLFAGNEMELATTLETVLHAPEHLQSIATAGRARAMSMFHPERLAAIFLSLLATRGF